VSKHKYAARAACVMSVESLTVCVHEFLSLSCLDSCSTSVQLSSHRAEMQHRQSIHVLEESLTRGPAELRNKALHPARECEF